MIEGAVTTERKIVIPLAVLAADRTAVPIQAVVDTGFIRFVTLSPDVLGKLGASAAGTCRALLGDGNLVELDVYVAKVRWHDEDREVLALQAEATPLTGMSLLGGSRVGFDAQDGGVVTIEAIA